VIAPALEARLAVTRSGGGDASFALNIELRLEVGVLVLFGPSGAGKTMTLEGVAGLTRPSSGFVRLAGETLFDAEGEVWLPRADRAGKLPMSLLEELGIAHRARARPDELSGGERQRVALARALAASPRLLLLDEPFASIDRAGRAALREMLRDILSRRRTPAILVTHDEVEAKELGDWLVPMHDGTGEEAVRPREFFAA
jgi:molybdate transport system ATP-binding protein